MPKVHYRKARKAYPNQGIEKGDMYYYTKLKLQRGGIVKRSKTPFKPSQLTTSEFKGTFLGAKESWGESDKDGAAIREAAEAIRELGNGEQEKFDNMPEGLQYGGTGQMLETRANECESIADELDNLADEMEGLEEPDEVDEPDDDEAPDFRAKTDAWETYQEELQEYESEVERIKDEVDSQLGNMPE